MKNIKLFLPLLVFCVAQLNAMEMEVEFPNIQQESMLPVIQPVSQEEWLIFNDWFVPNFSYLNLLYHAQPLPAWIGGANNPDEFISLMLQDLHNPEYLEFLESVIGEVAKSPCKYEIMVRLMSNLIHERFNDRRMTLLHRAAFEGRINLVRALIEAGADVNISDVWEISPLHDAASYGHTDVVEFLLSAHARIDTRNHAGQTPLHLAVAFRHITTAKVLVQSGADCSAKDKNGQTPLDLAPQEILALIQNNNAQPRRSTRKREAADDNNDRPITRIAVNAYPSFIPGDMPSTTILPVFDGKNPSPHRYLY